VSVRQTGKLPKSVTNSLLDIHKRVQTVRIKTTKIMNGLNAVKHKNKTKNLPLKRTRTAIGLLPIPTRI